MADPTIFVRMYRGLLGDCFLIRIIDGGSQSSILIDCGVLQGADSAEERMRAIVADIAATSKGTLDLVVVTHEHADHLSGFAFARDMFFDDRTIKIGRLWLAWTEDPKDKQAIGLGEKFGKRRQTVQKLAAMTKRAAAASPFALAIRGSIGGLDAFLGCKEADGPALVAGARLTIGETLDKLQEVVGEANTEYLEPGDVVVTPGAVSLKAFVLGPPRDEALLFKDLPSKGDAQETYVTTADLNIGLLMRLAGVRDAHAGKRPDATPGDPALEPADHSPFAPRDRLIHGAEVHTEPDTKGKPLSPAEQALVDTRAWLRARYFGSTDDDPATARLRKRRRIDADWLAAAGEFALKLDSDTNNTSLVLAFELPDGSFMLFAGDAQVGNWLSWHRQRYVDGTRTLSATNILNRARLYKVGHHGSHNATLAKDGLALMKRPDLIAMVSTDEVFARKQGRSGWLMPNPGVKKILLDQTQGRLIRGDRRWAAPPQSVESRWPADPDIAGYSAPADFKARLDESDDLYVEYRIFGGPDAR